MKVVVSGERVIMRTPLLIFCFAAFLQAIPSVSASVAWNGDEWLVAWGGFNDYTQKRFERDINLALIRDGNITVVPFGEKNWPMMGGVYWADGYWLVGYYPELHPSSKLAKYDGNNITVLPPVLQGSGSIGYNGEYFLIGGQVERGLGVWEPALLKYDGENLTRLNFTFNVLNLGWDGKFWLIGAQDREGVKLVRYDGSSFIEVGKLAFRQIGRNIPHIISNGDYWLISGQREDMADMAKLVKFDGEIVVDLSKSLSFKDISDIKWNGEYWLIGGDGIIKYDGNTFTGKETLGDGIIVNRLAWNGEYWLITNWRKTRIIKYDGRSMVDLTSKLKAIGEPLLYREIAWNGEYWLIEMEKQPAGEYSLVKYDGRDFTEINPKSGALNLEDKGIKVNAFEDENVKFSEEDPTVFLGIFLILLLGILLRRAIRRKNIIK